MPVLACPACATRDSVTRFKRNGRCYVRCRLCKAERTERESRAAAVTALATVESDEQEDQQWGGEERETIDEPMMHVPLDTTEMDAAEVLITLANARPHEDAITPASTAQDNAVVGALAVENVSVLTDQGTTMQPIAEHRHAACQTADDNHDDADRMSKGPVISVETAAVSGGLGCLL